MKTFSINHVLNHWGACMALMRVVVVRIMTRIFCIRKLKTKKNILNIKDFLLFILLFTNNLLILWR